MPINIGPSPDITFTNPLGWLRGCHDRIKHFLSLLMTVATRRRGEALHREDRETLAAALRYFREAAPMHTEDEEQSLFPRLRASKSPSAVAARAVLDALEAEHHHVHQTHAEVEILAERWMREGVLPSFEAKRLIGLLQQLQDFYEKHMAIEDREAFSVASVVLTEKEMIAVGREMAIRRGIDPDLAIAYPMDSPAR
ncbi:MAG: hemerythrin domain-containing protein [Candidatus Manganitrophaceae bacterium]|nr:MAG: hemerythrin domain-containing protein [Candidatus Manganitrophaceae bacterium]